MKLQFGHGWAAVENLSRSKSTGLPVLAASIRPPLGGRGELLLDNFTHRGGIPLQFGHGWAAVENAKRSGRSGAGSSASIRPRLGGRGERNRLGNPCKPRRGFNSATAGRPWRTETR